MAKYAQADHRISIQTPLGADVLYLVAVDGSENASRLFSYHLEMFSDETDIQPNEIVGKNVTIKLESPGGAARVINGHMTRFANLGTGDRGTQYRGEVVPWLWFLTKTSDCRVFQSKNVKQIIEQILGEYGFSDYEFKLNGDPPTRDYCVQYRETDCNFISRLLEEEGAYYYFKHEDGKHTLIMSDHAGGYMDASGPDKNAKLTTEKAGDLRNDNLTSWEHQYEFKTGKWTMSDYNFEKPNNSRDATVNILKVETKSVLDLENIDKYEVYDYSGEHDEKSVGENLVKRRMEAEEASFDVVSGASICRSFGPGVKFTVEKHRHSQEEGKEYVITGVSHSARVGSFIAGAGAAGSTYSNRFTCIPSDKVMRPKQTSPKPQIHGAQTAVVTGPPGEEIYVDKYGRVKVQFHWDREGKMDDKSSCWVRAAMPAAGKGWGFMAIPRIGQEVVVTFLEGDPDQPLITGSVYNPGQMPSRELPGKKSKSGFKTNSTPGGDGHNEITVDDEKGKETVYIHGEKDVNVRCKNNYHQIIGYEKEDGSYRELVHQDYESIIKGDDIAKLEGNKQYLVKGNVDQVTSGNQKEKIGGDKHLIVGGDAKTKIGGDGSLKVGSNQNSKIGMDYALDAGMNVHIKAGMTMVLEAGLQLSLKVGGNFVDISPVGVAINGTMVLINSGGAAGSGGGCNAAEPAEAEEANPTEVNMDGFSETGQKSCPS
jgi:type VI secretion system secreted protein VgrG